MTIFDETQIARIFAAANAAGDAEPLALTLHGASAGDGSPLAAVAREIVAALPATRVAVVSGADQQALPALPALTLARGGRGGHYLAVPGGPEVEPLVGLVCGLLVPPDATLAAELAFLADDVQLTVFIGPSCPHCPRAVSVAHALALASPRVRPTVVDAELHKALAAQVGARSVPLTLIDGELSWFGVLPQDEVVARLRWRDDPALFAARALQSLVETGRLAKAAERVRDAEGPGAFAAAWRESTTSTRIALLLLAEEVLEADRAALDPAVGQLVSLLHSGDQALSGDTVDLLGRVAHPAARQPIERLAKTTTDPDMAEAAAEALEAIAERTGPMEA